MVKKTEERKDIKEEKKDIFKTWADSYTAVSKMWEDSYIKLYKPWLESTGELFEKAALLPKDAAPKQYKEFYDEWVKTYQNTFGDFYPIPTLKSNKETLERLLIGAEESNKLYRSWIARLEENSQKTREVLKGEPDPVKYKEAYDLWIKSYGKIFDELLELPARENIKNLFENYTGIPDFYSETFLQISKLWKNSYAKLYEPWMASVSKLSEKAAEISKGGASPEAYKEFYTLWQVTYQETYGKLFDFRSQPSKEVFENFALSANIYLNLYKSWIAALENLSEKAEELSKRTADPEASKEFYNLWVRMYEKAFDSFFEDTPAVGPMKEILEPVKNAAKIYADTFTKISKMWVKSYSSSASQA
ncbi:MAG: hypothetical protein O8C66_09220 [Candidatus Methanoperedens sp.]|nr:hypothetical protein [Candidatus Methanoperedens sp.]MCZ7370676.1 hypothetical protein [Candidatus Methanoperedens sp.]